MRDSGSPWKPRPRGSVHAAPARTERREQPTEAHPDPQRERRVAELRNFPGQAHARVWGATAIIIDNLRRRLEAVP